MHDNPSTNHPVATQTPMTEHEARSCVQRINAGMNSVRLDVLELDERQGWRALGYESWRACVATEFGASESYLYQLADAARVDRAISTIVEMPPVRQSHARELAPLLRAEPESLPEVWRELNERHGENLTAGDIREVVQERIGNGPKMSMAVHYSSESPEWYTPPEIIERAVAALGVIDLDPCSNSRTDPRIPALNHFTAEEDGLTLLWFGRVYMNPPYGREIVAWVDKLATEYESGRVEHAIALVPARTDTAWFRRLPAYLVCFVSGRLSFSDHDNAAPFPSACLYLGDNPAAFVQAFGSIGTIYRRMERGEAPS